jgi:hypothetical protein
MTLFLYHREDWEFRPTSNYQLSVFPPLLIPRSPGFEQTNRTKRLFDDPGQAFPEFHAWGLLTQSKHLFLGSHQIIEN